MQLAATLTEYILAGLPITVSLTYLVMVVAIKFLGCAPPSSEPHAGLLTGLGITLLGVAYVVGVMAHAATRKTFKESTRAVEDQTWRDFGAYALPLLPLLGPLAAHEANHTDCKGRVDRGWVLWRMRLFVLGQCDGTGRELLRLQDVSRAARSAPALLLALVIGLAGAVTHALCNCLGCHWTFLLPGLVLAPMLWMVCWPPIRTYIASVYGYRWGVVCRASIAAFIGYATGLPLPPPVPPVPLPETRPDHQA